MGLKSVMIREKTKLLRTCFVLAILFLATSGISWGYVLPGKQIIDLMSDNFSKFKSMIVVLSIRPAGEEAVEVESGLVQKIWLQTPGFFSKKVMGEKEDQDSLKVKIQGDIEDYPIFYHLLFMGRGNEAQTALISRMGIDLNTVSFTRKDGIIACRIGDPDIKSPCFILEKDRFLPLEIKCCVRGKTGPVMLSIRFEDYRKIEKGWYPHLVTSFLDGVPWFSCTVKDLETNPPITANLSPIPLENILPAASCAGREGDLQKERFENIIKSLKNRYK
ncbi:hypothetical protein ACFL2O_06550 [Thermodesulfobacteriota bacterium]